MKHLSKMHGASAIMLMIALTGCGASNSNISSNAGKASLSAKVVFGSGSVAKSAALPANLPSNVASLRMTVTGTGADGNPIPVVRSTFGNVSSSTITGIYPGSVSLAVQALNNSGAVVYEGYATDQAVASNATSQVRVYMSAPTVKANEVACLQCHETTLDQTGQNLVASYKLSGHYTNMAFTDGNGVGAGCVGCHGPSHNVPNPYANGRCFDCHTDKVTLHANSDATAGANAMYAPTNYAENCNACHQPHNANSGNAERHAWAQSAHGAVDGAAWTHYEFQKGGSYLTCQRCHTASGFKAFAASGLTAFTPTASVAGATDSANEVLACDACHTNNKFDMRTVGAFTAPYTVGNDLAGKKGATVTFPSVGETNLCIPCHAGLVSGVGSVTNFAATGFSAVNPHYLAAAGTMYMSVGFTDFTSASAAIGTSTYAKSLTIDSTSAPGYGISGGVTSTHRKLGTSAINGDSHNPSVFVAGKFDANGPCVTCHLNANGAPAGDRAGHGHNLEIDENAYNQVCVNCHTSENTVPLTAQNFKAVFLEPQSEAFQTTLALAVKLLKDNYNIDYNPNAYPYYYQGGTTTAQTDWTKGGTVNGKKLLGAAYNIQLLTKDPAAYAHARSYSRRLLYDTLDFLDDGVINLSVGTTALAVSAQGTAQTNPVYGKFTKGTAGYNAANGSITTIATGTSEAMLYLLGWSRSTGAWNSPERP